ncbi:MAG TPA: serine/threonine-protein kinase [Thermoanaerobaculia bacterium]|jgi:serine/threonine-protein kinase|nr:serine/threonine-protein kinase [Thermoanaerobaculia bacterium]
MLQKIGKYEIFEQIGVGGFGAVYKGRDPFIKRTVAVKTCQVNDDEIKNRFFREAELAGNLHHRNITTIYDFGVENGIPYIVQEFLTGEDLDKKIKRGDPIPMARKIEILMAITDGLGYAHSAKIVHRDVKPANVRILEDGTVKVMDFGIAKSLQSDSNLTQTGITLGTSAYLAPEQIRGEAIDARTDIFAMGVLAYELVTYRKPFRGEHLSTVLYKILNDSPEPITNLVQDAPPALIAAIERATAKNAADRYPTMEAFRRDMQAVYRELQPETDSGNSATVRTIRPASDEMETTLATPSSGVNPLGITPPSGALARVPAASDRTPTSASLNRPPLELINFRNPEADPSEETLPPSARVPPGQEVRPTSGIMLTQASPVARTRLIVFGVLLIVIGAGAAYLLIRGTTPNPTTVEEAPVQRAAVPPPAPTAPMEFPEPKLGHGEAAPTAAPAAAPTSPPAVAAAPEPAPTAAPVAAAPKKYRVQFSSVPIATLAVDGKTVGPSIPAKTLSLQEGEHTVRFEAKDFPPYEKRFRVSGSSENRVHYQFPVSMLVIEARGWAGARVLIDGKYRGTLPDASRLKIPAGTYNVTLSREGANPVTETITVPEGTPKTWSPPPPAPATGGTS